MTPKSWFGVCHCGYRCWAAQATRARGGEAINMGSSGIVGFVSGCRCGLDGRCLTKSSVYKITCKLCKSTGNSEYYIGESKRPIRYRFNEHLGDARLRRMDTPLGEHILNSHTDISNADVNNAFHIEILSTDRDVPEVKIDESVHIRNLLPTLNTMSSSWPLVHSVG